MDISKRNLVKCIQRYMRRFHNEFARVGSPKKADALERKWTKRGGVIELALRGYRPLSEGSEGGRKAFQSYMFRHVRGTVRDFKVLFDKRNN